MKLLHEKNYWEWLDTVDPVLQSRFWPLAEDWTGEYISGGFSTSSKTDDVTVSQVGPDNWIVTQCGVTRTGETLEECFKKIDAVTHPVTVGASLGAE